MKTLILLILSSFLLSCSGPQKKSRPNYSSDTENEFESIENDRKRILEYYRELRKKNWKKYKKPKPSIRRATKARPIRKKPRPTLKPALSGQVVEEMKIEMRQHMSYFCMENRKSRKFSGKADCHAFTQNALSRCEGKYPVIRDRKIVHCIKRVLK